MMNTCQNCKHGTIFSVGQKTKVKTAIVYGLCGKDGGAYPIYIPQGKCKEWEAK